MSKKKRSTMSKMSPTAKKSVGSKKKSRKSSKSSKTATSVAAGMLSGKLKSFQLGKLFSLDNAKKTKKNFSTSFEYGNFDIDLKGNLNQGERELEFNIKGRKFNFSGKLIVNEKVFSDLQKMFDHVLNNIQKMTKG